MAINKFKFIATTAEKVGAANVDVELYVTWGAESAEQVVNQSANGIKETIVVLQEPVEDIEDFTLNLFELDVSDLDEEVSKILLKSVEIIGMNNSTSIKTLSIANWPENLWLGKIPGAMSKIKLGNV